ncbi:MAG TPA: DUF4340 domain-containing protein [Firmicutes bacterium]|nr:DUF4340 domain-containing protein [Bacillota bacterium]
MKIRYNFIFIPILLLVALAVWYMSTREESIKAARRISDRAVLDFGAVDIIEIQNHDSILRLERLESFVQNGDSEWKMTQPYEVGCRPEPLNELIETIKTAEVERDIPDVTEEQLSEYGLTEPPLRLKLMSRNGTVQMDLLIGQNNPSGSARYATMHGSSACFLLPIYESRSIEITPDDLRDNRAIVFSESDIVEMQLNSEQADIHFKNEDSKWMITSPQSFTANPTRMDILFQNIGTLVAEEFLPANASDPELETLSVRLEMKTVDGATGYLTLHGEDTSRGIFARSSYQPTPFIVQPYIYNRLALDSGVFFHTELINISRALIKRIIVRQPGARNLEIAKTNQSDTNWQVLRPDDPPQSSPEDFDKFIEMVFALQPQTRIPPPEKPSDYGIDPVYFMLIEVHPFDDSAKNEIAIGNRDHEGNYYATTDNLSYFVINAELLDNFIAATDVLRGK